VLHESKQYHEIDFDLHGIVRGDISTQVFAHVGGGMGLMVMMRKGFDSLIKKAS